MYQRLKINKTTQSDQVSPKTKNSRFYKRYVPKDRLTLVYEHDILTIENFSYNGFCLKVSPRVLQSCHVGQSCYFKNFRLLKKQASIYARVIWMSKETSMMGFCVDGSSEVFHSLIEPVLLPLQIAASLKQIDILNDSTEVKTEVYRGCFNSELCLEYSKVENDFEISKITMFSSSFFLKWNKTTSKITTGIFSYNTKSDTESDKKPVTNLNSFSQNSNIIYLGNFAKRIKQHPISSPIEGLSSEIQALKTTDSTQGSTPKPGYLLSTSDLVFIEDKLTNYDHIDFFSKIIDASYLKNKEDILKILSKY